MMLDLMIFIHSQLPGNNHGSQKMQGPHTALLLSVTKSICRNVLEIFFKPLISTRAEMQISELNERVVQKYQVAPVEVEMSDRREREPVRNSYKLIF